MLYHKIFAINNAALKKVLKKSSPYANSNQQQVKQLLRLG